MPRLIHFTNTRPYRIEPKDFPTDGKSIWICACGLTKNPPYCDKSHNLCDGESADTLCTYENGVRRTCPADPTHPPAAAPRQDPA